MVKKLFINTILFFSVLILFVVNYSPAYALDQKDIETKIDTPSITPPDYSKNECPVCDGDYGWWGDKGCCKISYDGSDRSGKFTLECKQPNIVVCKKGGLFFCLQGKGCLTGGQSGSFQPNNLCTRLVVASEREKCSLCMNGNNRVWTAIGCLPIDLASLVSQNLLTFAISIGGGVSFLVFLYGAFLVLTSSGDIERIKSGKNHIIFSLKGLLLLIFGLFVFRIIVVNILDIPGFK